MRKNRLFAALLCSLVVVSVMISACKKEDDSTDDNTTPTPTDIKRGYSGSASYGDLVTFEINQTQHAYSVHNETTGLNENGSYSIMDGELNGVYKVTNATATFYAVELAGKIIAANFPTGRAENNMSFGVSSSINNVGNENNIAGNYIYMHFADDAINGNARNKEWGVISVFNTGNYLVQPFATGGSGSMISLAPEDFTASLPLVSGQIGGTWVINGSNHERLDVSVTGQTGVQFTGFANTSTNAPVFLLDMGTGNGFLAALKINPSSLAQVAGLYKFVGVVADGSRIANNVTVNADGTGTVVIIKPDGTLEYESIQNITQCPNIPNAYYANHLTGSPATVTGKLYAIVSGDVAMYFIFDNQGLFNAYGAGAKMN